MKRELGLQRVEIVTTFFEALHDMIVRLWVVLTEAGRDYETLKLYGLDGALHIHGPS